jgi:hypothetical protein
MVCSPRLGLAAQQPIRIDSVTALRILSLPSSLLREDSKVSTAKQRDGVVDTLVAIALSSAASSTDERRSVSKSAVMMLGTASSLGTRRAIPALSRVARFAPDDSVARVATVVLAGSADTTGAVAALRELALLPRHQGLAIDLITVAYGRLPIGRDALRALYFSDKITDPRARASLDRWREEFGPRPPR